MFNSIKTLLNKRKSPIQFYFKCVTNKEQGITYNSLTPWKVYKTVKAKDLKGKVVYDKNWIWIINDQRQKSFYPCYFFEQVKSPVDYSIKFKCKEEIKVPSQGFYFTKGKIYKTPEDKWLWDCIFCSFFIFHFNFLILKMSCL